MHVILKSVNFKINIIVIFNITSTDFVLMSAILKEMRIAQRCSKSERTLNTKTCQRKLFLHNEQKALYYKKLSVLQFFF